MDQNAKIAPKGRSSASETALAIALEAAIKRFRMYPPDHPACRNAAEAPHALLTSMLNDSESVVLGLIEGELAIGGVPSGFSVETSALGEAMKSLGLRSIVLKKGVTVDQLSAFIHFFSAKLSKSDEWPDLARYVAEKGLEQVEIDTLRYELVGKDEKIVPAATVVGAGSGGTSLTVEFARILKEHPELLLRFLSDKDSARVSISQAYSHAIDYDRLCDDAEKEVGALTEEQVVQIIALGLKDKLSAESTPDVVDMQNALFDIKSVVEKINRPDLIPKIRRIIEDLNLVDDKYVDLILEGRYSKRRLAFEELEESVRSIESGVARADQLAMLPKRLEVLGDADYSRQLIDRIFDGEFSLQKDADTATPDAMALTVTKSAVKSDCESSCDAIADRVMKELADGTINRDRFLSLYGHGQQLCRWYLKAGKMQEFLDVLRSFHRYTSTEVVYADGVQFVADDFVFELGAVDVVRSLMECLIRDFEKQSKVIYEILARLRTQASALALCEYISYPDRSVRLLLLRILSEYGEPAIKAFEMVIGEMQLPHRSVNSPNLPDDLWYRIRNIVFVSGNIRLPESVGVVEKFARDPDPRLAEEVIVALEKIADGKASRIIAGYLHFRSENVCRRAVAALGNVGDPESMTYLAELYQSHPDMRIQLAPVIARVGGDKAVDFLRDAFVQDDGFFKNVYSKKKEEERISIIGALGRIRSQHSLERLKEVERISRAGFMGLFKSNAVLDAASRAVHRLSREIAAGQKDQ
jgi:hypothetical protein